MLSLGISEMLLIAVVGCLVVDHKKVPGTLKHVALYYKKFQEIKTEVLDTIKGICTNGVAVADDLHVDYEDSHHIYGNDGKLYRRYKIRDLIKKERGNTPTIAPDAASAGLFDVAGSSEAINGGDSGKKASSGNTSKRKRRNTPTIAPDAASAGLFDVAGSSEAINGGDSGKEVCAHINVQEDGNDSCT